MRLAKLHRVGLGALLGTGGKAMNLWGLQRTHLVMNAELSFICLLWPFDLHNRVH